MSRFAIGDVVRLKSGGLAMTIESFRRGVDDRKEAHCVWLQADGAHHGVFPLEILEHVGEPALNSRERLRPATVEEALSRRHAAMSATRRATWCVMCGLPLDHEIHGPRSTPTKPAAGGLDSGGSLDASLLLDLIRDNAATIRSILGPLPDPRIGKLCRMIRWSGRQVARVVAVEPGGALLMRGDGWPPTYQDYRAAPDEVEWLEEPIRLVPTPPT